MKNKYRYDLRNFSMFLFYNLDISYKTVYHKLESIDTVVYSLKQSQLKTLVLFF